MRKRHNVFWIIVTCGFFLFFASDFILGARKAKAQTDCGGFALANCNHDIGAGPCTSCTPYLWVNEVQVGPRRGQYGNQTRWVALCSVDL